MKNTTFNINLVNEKLVKGLDIEGNYTSNWELASLSSAGGILSNVEDLAKYGIAHFNKSNLDLMLMTKKTVKINDPNITINPVIFVVLISNPYPKSIIKCLISLKT